MLENRQPAIARQVGPGSRGLAARSVPPAPASRRQEEGVHFVTTPAENVEPGEPALIAASHLAVDQAGPHLEVVHGLNHERIALRPVVAAACDQADADGISRAIRR